MSVENNTDAPASGSDREDIQPDKGEDVGFTWLDKAIVWLGKRLSLVFAAIVVVSFYEIVRRYVFDSPTLWVHETVTFAGATLFVIGGLYALATDRHVRIVLIYDPPFPALLKVVILIAVAVMTLQFLLHLIRDLRGKGDK